MRSREGGESHDSREGGESQEEEGGENYWHGKTRTTKNGIEQKEEIQVITGDNEIIDVDVDNEHENVKNETKATYRRVHQE